MKINFYIVLIVIFTGCSGYQYISSPHFIPLNKSKGEFKTNISLNHFNLGYSISDHISIFSTYYHRNRLSSINLQGAMNKENAGVYYRSDDCYEINFGASYFNKGSDLIYEVLVGSGFGEHEYSNIKDLFPNYDFKLNANKINIFFQPDIGIKVIEFIEFGLFSRFNYINYFDMKTSLDLGANHNIEPEDMYFNGRNNANLFFMEPGLFARAGIKNVKASILFSPTINLTRKTLRYRSVNLYFSLFLNFSFIKKR